jgi:Outer membrane protein
MKKTIILSLCILLGCSLSSQAQSFKFGHINLQELVMLMPEYDSAVVQFTKFQNELQETYDGIETEYRTKFLEYQQKNATWSAAILETKQQELQTLEQRLNQFSQTAQQDMQQMQQTLYGPVYQKANEAVKKIGKDQGFTYIYELGSGALAFFNEEQSVDVLPIAKAALGIPAEKVMPSQQGAR